MIVEVYDVGGTWVRGALYEGDKKHRRLLLQVRESTEKDFCAQIRRISEMLRDGEKSDHATILLPGPVEKGRLLKAPPLGITQPLDIRKDLDGLAEEMTLENDINGATYGELHEGFGKRFRNFYLLTMSTGIGAGIVIDRKIVGGKSGEVGHIIVEPFGRIQKDSLTRCGCGNYGCWGALCSGQGIEKLVKKYFPAKEMSNRDFFLRVAEKDPTAHYLLKRIREYNAQAIGTMLNMFDVEAIIIMGSLGRKQFDHLIPTRPMIREYTINPVPVIIPTLLGDDIGLIGAYHLAVQAQWKKQ